jgi:hypothetical protein
VEGDGVGLFLILLFLLFRAMHSAIAECANAMYTIICTELKLCQILHMEINSQPSRVILVILNFDLSSEL